MKNLVLALAALLVTAHAEARSLKLDAKTATLKLFMYQQGTELGDRNIKRGAVTLNESEGQVSLSLFPSFNCPPGLMCAQVMPAPEIFVGQLEAVTTGGCNETIYTALKPSLDVAGQSYRLTLVDNRGQTCKAIRAIPATEVTLEIFNADGSEELHRFEGGELN